MGGFVFALREQRHFNGTGVVESSGSSPTHAEQRVD